MPQLPTIQSVQSLPYYIPNSQINIVIFDGLLELLADYELWDIIDIVDALDIGENKVWVNLKLKTIRQLIDETQNKMTLAKDIIPLAWCGGPPRLSVEGGEHKRKFQLMRGSLMHYIADIILRQTLDCGSKSTLATVAAARLNYEGP